MRSGVGRESFFALRAYRQIGANVMKYSGTSGKPMGDPTQAIESGHRRVAQASQSGAIAWVPSDNYLHRLIGAGLVGLTPLCIRASTFAARDHQAIQRAADQEGKGDDSPHDSMPRVQSAKTAGVAVDGVRRMRQLGARRFMAQRGPSD